MGVVLLPLVHVDFFRGPGTKTAAYKNKSPGTGLETTTHGGARKSSRLPPKYDDCVRREINGKKTDVSNYFIVAPSSPCTPARACSGHKCVELLVQRLVENAEQEEIYLPK